VKLIASDVAAEDLFGDSVAISGDTVVIGAPDGVGAADDGSHSGSAYIFTRNSGGVDAWGQVTKLTASDAAPNNLFGDNVAIDGDTVVIVAHDVGIYVFERNEGGADGWGEVVKLTPSVGSINSETVAISEDTIIAADYIMDAEGVAFLFERNAQGMADSWGQVAELKVSVGGRFGISVGISDDTVIVGAPTTPPYSYRSGSSLHSQRG